MRGKIKKLVIYILTITAFAFPFFAFANPVYTVNAKITRVEGKTLTAEAIKVTGSDGNEVTGATRVYTLPNISDASSYKAGDYVSFTVSYQAGYNGYVPDTLSHEMDPNAQVGVGTGEMESTGSNDSTVTFKLFNKTCSQAEALTCWISFAYSWAQGAILLLATGAIIGAGIIYMTSAGNPKQIALAKKLIYGAISGVGVIVLGRFFLTRVVGVPWI